MQPSTRASAPEALTSLLRTHAVSTAADAAITVALAGSLFFGVSPDSTRDQLTLCLLLTLAPFAVAVAFIGKFADRYVGASPQALALTSRARAGLACVLAISPLGVLMYPASFGVLVLGRIYAAAKRAYVPAVVGEPAELVAANARISRTGSMGGVAGGIVAASVLHVGGASVALLLAAALHVGAGALAGRCRAESNAGRAPIAEEAVPPAVAIRIPLAIMATLRAATGLLWLVLAFSLTADRSLIAGLVVLAVPIGSFSGTYVSPRLRRNGVEENLILAGCATIALGATAVAAILGARGGMIAIALGVALASSVARHAFDSIVQREITSDQRTRVFARCEATLQLAWVGGALVAAAGAVHAPAAYVAVAVAFSGVLSVTAVRSRRVRLAAAAMLRADDVQPQPAAA
jgi:hypothetical protein